MAKKYGILFKCSEVLVSCIADWLVNMKRIEDLNNIRKCENPLRSFQNKAGHAIKVGCSDAYVDGNGRSIDKQNNKK